MIFWPLVALLCVAALLSYPLVVRPQLDHRRHARALVHIAELERELGFDVPLEQCIDRDLEIANRDWYYAALAKQSGYTQSVRMRSYGDGDPPEPAHRIYGDCAVCGHRVAVNAGRCRGATTKGDAICAKVEWLNRTASLTLPKL